MKKFIALLMVLLVVCLGGCSKIRTLEDVIESKKLIVGLSADYAPYEFMDASKKGNEQYVGADIEFAKYIAKELGVELVFENVAFELLLGELQIGTIDITISGFTWKDERVGKYQISDSYFDVGEGGQGILIKAADAEKFTDVDSLNKADVKLGGQNSSVQLDLIKKFMPNAKASAFELIGLGKVDLDQGIVDGISIASNVAKIIMDQNPNKYVLLDDVFEVSSEQSGLYCLANIENESLMNKVNEIIAAMDKTLYQTWYDEGVAKAIELGQF